MGNVLRRVSTRYNAENRAHKIIEQKVNIPKAAPSFPTAVKEIERFQEQYPEGIDHKNERLVSMLKQVKVDSTEVSGKTIDVDIDESFKRQGRNLPQMKQVSTGPTLLVDDDDVPTGKISVTRALRLLAKYQQDKQNNSAEKLAKEYGLELQDTKNILEYFKIFQLVPLNPKEPNMKLPMDHKRELEDIQKRAAKSLPTS